MGLWHKFLQLLVGPHFSKHCFHLFVSWYLKFHPDNTSIYDNPLNNGFLSHRRGTVWQHGNKAGTLFLTWKREAVVTKRWWPILSSDLAVQQQWKRAVYEEAVSPPLFLPPLSLPLALIPISKPTDLVALSVTLTDSAQLNTVDLPDDRNIPTHAGKSVSKQLTFERPPNQSNLFPYRCWFLVSFIIDRSDSNERRSVINEQAWPHIDHLIVICVWSTRASTLWGRTRGGAHQQRRHAGDREGEKTPCLVPCRNPFLWVVCTAAHTHGRHTRFHLETI